MMLKEKGKKDADPVSMGWDEAQAAIAAGTHVPADAEDGAPDDDQPEPEPEKKPEPKKPGQKPAAS